MALYLFAGLALATDGNFYGTAVDLNGEESGTIFQFTPGGTLTTVYTFESGIGPAYGPFGPLNHEFNQEVMGQIAQGVESLIEGYLIGR